MLGPAALFSPAWTRLVSRVLHERARPRNARKPHERERKTKAAAPRRCMSQELIGWHPHPFLGHGWTASTGLPPAPAWALLPCHRPQRNTPTSRRRDPGNPPRFPAGAAAAAARFLPPTGGGTGRHRLCRDPLRLRDAICVPSGLPKKKRR